MKLEILSGLKPQVINCTRVLITTDDGRPLAISSEWAPGAVITSHAGEPNFSQLLKTLGVDRTVVTEEIPAARLADFTF